MIKIIILAIFFIVGMAWGAGIMSMMFECKGSAIKTKKFNILKSGQIIVISTFFMFFFVLTGVMFWMACQPYIKTALLAVQNALMSLVFS